MYFTMFNLSYFACCCVLYVKRGSFSSVPNLVVFVVCLALFVYMYFKFVVDPDPFGYLRYSFRYT